MNELQIAPSGGRSEFIELFNGGDNPVGLSDLTVSDSRDLSGVITSGITDLQPGTFLVLVPDSARYTSTAGVTLVGEVSPWPSLNNSGDRIVLRMSGSMADSISYTSDWYEKGRSLERIDPAVPGFLRSNWAPSESAEGATPGVLNSVFDRDTTPPSLQSASYSTPLQINIFISEPVFPGSISNATVTVDGFRAGSPNVGSDLSVLTIPSPPSRRVVRVSGLLDFAGNEMMPSSAVIAQLPERGDISITEIMFDPEVLASGAPAPEFIELHNDAETDIAVSSLIVEIRSSPSGSVRIFPLGRRERTLKAGGFAVLYNETVPASLEDPETRSSLVLSYTVMESLATAPLLIPAGGSSLGLPLSGALIRLVSSTMQTLTSLASPVLIDSVQYSANWHDTRWKSTRARSLSRLSNCQYKQPALCWTTTLVNGGASPGESVQKSDYSVPGSAASVAISEIMYAPIARSNDSRPDQTEFLEVVNTGINPLDVNGMYALLKEPERNEPDSIRLVHRPTVLEPGTYAAVFNVPGYVPDGDREYRAFLEAGFGLPTTSDGGRISDNSIIPTRQSLGLSSNGELLRLYLPGGILLDELYYRPSWHNPAIVNGSGASLERIDLSSSSSAPQNWTTSNAPGGATPGAVNSAYQSFPATGAVRDWQVTPVTISPYNYGPGDRMKISLTGIVPSFSAIVTVYDLAGRPVKILHPDPGTPDALLFLWDGTDDAGRLLPTGFYVLHASDPGGSTDSFPALKKAVGLIR